MGCSTSHQKRRIAVMVPGEIVERLERRSRREGKALADLAVELLESSVALAPDESEADESGGVKPDLLPADS